MKKAVQVIAEAHIANPQFCDGCEWMMYAGGSNETFCRLHGARVIADGSDEAGRYPRPAVCRNSQAEVELLRANAAPCCERCSEADTEFHERVYMREATK